MIVIDEQLLGLGVEHQFGAWYRGMCVSYLT